MSPSTKKATQSYPPGESTPWQRQTRWEKTRARVEPCLILSNEWDGKVLPTEEFQPELEKDAKPKRKQIHARRAEQPAKGPRGDYGRGPSARKK